MAPKSDEKVELASLVERARAGEEAAFDALARAVLPRMRRWALVLTGDPDEADDAVQTTLVLVYRKLDGFRGEARFTTWLYRVLRNVVSDRHRRSTRREDVRTDFEARAMTDTRSMRDPAREMDDRRTRSMVERFFDELPERQREVFDLVDLQGFEPVEAAEMLEITASTARVHLHRARRSIRESLLEADPTLALEYRT